MPCSEKRARLLLQRGRAVVVRVHPFTIRLKERVGGKGQPLRLKLDPDSKATGLARARESRVGAQPVEDFLAHDPKRLARIQAPLRDAATVNATRWALYAALCAAHLPVEAATGGRTQYNRKRLRAPKTHCLDAACVGHVDALTRWHVPILGLQATGRGSYQRTRLDRHGVPRGYLRRRKRHFGCQTGDLVRADVPAGNKAGVQVGRIAVRASGSVNLQTPTGVVHGIGHRYCTRIHRADGYGSHPQPKIARNPTTEDARTGAACAAALSLPSVNAGGSRAIE